MHSAAGNRWGFLWVADFPFSIVSFVLVWRHPALAMIWMVVVRTLWWSALSRVAEALWKHLADRRSPELNSNFRQGSTNCRSRLQP